MTDYADLVKRLDENWGRRRIGDMSCLLADAADAIETLVRERDEARAESATLTQTLIEQAHNLTSRAEAAEAEVARLREALTNIVHFEPERHSWSVNIARAALEGK